jgi:hemoglobin
LNNIKTYKDLKTHSDIKILIDCFYDKVILDPEIGMIFNDIAKVSWDKHLPVMYSFWSSILLGSDSYSGNPMIKHLELNKIFPLNEKHFARWLLLWEETVNDNFSGTMADQAINRAKNIASIIQSKILFQKK